MLIDETATHERYDLPYNLVKIIAEQHFSAIASELSQAISYYSIVYIFDEYRYVHLHLS